MAVLKYCYLKIKDVQIVSEIEDVINYMVAILNIKCGDEEEKKHLDGQMKIVYELIVTNPRFGSLTIPEIKEALKMYVAREFGNIKVFRLLDAVSIGEILTAYIDFRNESLNIFEFKKQNMLFEKKEISPEESNRILMEGTNRVFAEYKKTKVIEIGCSYIYDFLVEKGKISLAGPNTPKLTAYYELKIQEVKAALLLEYQTKTSPFKNERTRISEELDEIKSGKSSQIIVGVKMLVLKEYFDTIETETIF